MRILLTGGSGFVATKIIEALSCTHPDARIRVFDIVPPHLAELEFVEGNIRDAARVEEAARGATHVIHLASVVGVRQTEAEPEQTEQTIVQGTAHILEAAALAGVTSLVNVSSSEVYGDAGLDHISEEAPCRPVSTYGQAKVEGERLAAGWRDRSQLDARVVRLFNVYGMGQRPEFVVSRFADALGSGRRPTVYGSGEQVRSFCDVRDTVRGILAALFSQPQAEWVFNIGNADEPISMADLARRMCGIFGMPGEPSFVDFANSDRSEAREIWRRIPDVTRARDLLGFRADIPLAEGLRQFVPQARMLA